MTSCIRQLVDKHSTTRLRLMERLFDALQQTVRHQTILIKANYRILGPRSVFITYVLHHDLSLFSALVDTTLDDS